MRVPLGTGVQQHHVGLWLRAGPGLWAPERGNSSPPQLLSGCASQEIDAALVRGADRRHAPDPLIDELYPVVLAQDADTGHAP